MDIQVVDIGYGVKQNFNVGLVEIDIDTRAETFFIMDRAQHSVIYACIAPQLNIAKIIVPLKYGSLNDLVVGILDSDNEYNAFVIDRVKAQIVDGNTVNLEQ